MTSDMTRFVDSVAGCDERVDVNVAFKKDERVLRTLVVLYQHQLHLFTNVVVDKWLSRYKSISVLLQLRVNQGRRATGDL